MPWWGGEQRGARNREIKPASRRTQQLLAAINTPLMMKESGAWKIAAFQHTEMRPGVESCTPSGMVEALKEQ